MAIQIRGARIEDYHDLCTIYSELDELHRQEHTELFVKPNTIGRSRNYIEGLINDASKALFVAEYESKVIGLAECYIIESPDFPILKKRKWVQLDSIAVKRGFRNLGVGDLLLKEVTNWSNINGIKRVELKVYTFNKDAVEFYSNKGFIDINKTMYIDL
ncbi:GNAT family N-acetyltransferase [Sporosalibacterium faouarense]|uniref:GNAT family N-acetyltransferase n=1 Tax=Sporosalibacterium faouarense TaxID=516123 RepID=UPI00141C911B|nr:GNAT family N-acetyltransferase [Sporosalibacterium faouarense]MTI46429.1 GNAT family N-acetyltransferase [Bacillota bacterium]